MVAVFKSMNANTLGVPWVLGGVSVHVSQTRGKFTGSLGCFLVIMDGADLQGYSYYLLFIDYYFYYTYCLSNLYEYGFYIYLLFIHYLLFVLL